MLATVAPPCLPMGGAGWEQWVSVTCPFLPASWSPVYEWQELGSDPPLLSNISNSWGWQKGSSLEGNYLTILEVSRDWVPWEAHSEMEVSFCLLGSISWSNTCGRERTEAGPGRGRRRCSLEEGVRQPPGGAEADLAFQSSQGAPRGGGLYDP